MHWCTGGTCRSNCLQYIHNMVRPMRPFQFQFSTPYARSRHFMHQRSPHETLKLTRISGAAPTPRLLTTTPKASGTHISPHGTRMAHMLRQHGHHQAPVGGRPRGGPPTDVAHSTHSASSHTEPAEAGSSGRLTSIFLLRDSQSIVCFACWAHATAYHTEFQ